MISTIIEIHKSMKRPVGYISYTHGLDGKVKIVPLVPIGDFRRYLDDGRIYIDSGAWQRVVVKEKETEKETEKDKKVAGERGNRKTKGESDEIDDENREYTEIHMSIFAFDGRIFLCRIKHVDDIDTAKIVVKNEIFVDVDEDEDYIDAERIIGFNVYTNHGGDVLNTVRASKKRCDKSLYGKVVDCGDYGCGMLIEIELTNGKSEFIACNKTNIICIDRDEKSIVIRKDM